MDLSEKLNESAIVLDRFTQGFLPEIGIILGSGWGPVADRIQNPRFVSYADVPHMRESTATSHIGRFVFGELSGKKVMVMQGRLHGYEGYAAEEVAYPVWLMKKMGVHTLITVNAAGAVNESFCVGDYCLMRDMINFSGRNPLACLDADKLAFRFVPLKDAFNPSLRDVVKEVAAQIGAVMREGVYLGMLGPSFETPAEIKMFRGWGVDSVAMSVVEEVIAARHVDISVIGISLLTNMACGIGDSNPTDEEVLEVSKQKEKQSFALISGILERL
ncbi:MAG: purine-nucleoside phosphorylase [Eggerthellaceae bacterium]|nr:purine-nucleoside phosphorylase [Eggerthellaceae bacterium]